MLLVHWKEILPNALLRRIVKILNEALCFRRFGIGRIGWNSFAFRRDEGGRYQLQSRYSADSGGELFYLSRAGLCGTQGEFAAGQL